MMDKQKDEKFLERLNTQPKLRARMEALLNVTDNSQYSAKAEEQLCRGKQGMKMLACQILQIFLPPDFAHDL